MIKIKQLLFGIGLILVSALNAQTSDINGTVIADEDLEGIHIINRTAGKFTITNESGGFVIPVKLNDTIIISALKYKPETRIITQNSLDSKTLTVYLSENVNALDEVIIGKVLTGDLLSDVQNSDAKRDINFYDVGIPGYTGRRKTQSERRLQTASSLDPTLGGSLGGAGGSVSFDALINAVSGRTKMLKNRVKMERQEVCMNAAIADFSDLIFNENELDESFRTEYFYFASENEKFFELCNRHDDLQMFEFLRQKLIDYKGNLEIEHD